MPKISQFPAGGVAQNTDLIPIVRNGGDYTVTGYNRSAASGGSERFDLVTVSAVPEPAISVLGASAVIGGAVAWRRRRRSRPTA